MTFSDLSQYFKKLEVTASRNSMTEILAELFKKASKDEIGKICYLLQGRVAPLFEAIEFGVADKFMIRAIAKAYGVEASEVMKAFKRLGDLGSAAEEIRSTNKRIYESANLEIKEVYKKLYAITKESGEGSQEKKIGMLAELLQSVDALSGRYIARIPLDKLRLGFSDMTMLDSLSWMITGDKSLRNRLEDAYNVRTDIGYIATSVKEHGIKGLSHVTAKVGAPILPALCQRLPSADEMIKKMCRRPDRSVGGRASSTEASGSRVAVEPKYDGVRVQIHYETGRQKDSKTVRIKTFSRNLENTTEMFPELQGIREQLNAHEVILDSEAIGVDPGTGKLIPFQETMTRKRKHHIEETWRTVPLKFFVFDVLYKDGQDLLNKPLSERRSILEKTVKNGLPAARLPAGRGRQDNILTISPQIVTDSATELRQYHDEQLKAGLEGAVVKKWDSPYEPGRRGYSWVKFKEEEGKTGKLTDTIDAVVMGYYRGEGKRAGFGIGAFLVGVRKGEEFVTITKIGTGVSDELWKELKTAFSRQSSAIRPKEYGEVPTALIPDVWIEPKIVVEVAGDDLTKSSTHGAGIAIRFPRLVRIRTDKSSAQATTVGEVEKMYKQQRGDK